jgi:hypothetical protein
MKRRTRFKGLLCATSLGVALILSWFARTVFSEPVYQTPCVYFQGQCIDPQWLMHGRVQLLP